MRRYIRLIAGLAFVGVFARAAETPRGDKAVSSGLLGRSLQLLEKGRRSAGDPLVDFTDFERVYRDNAYRLSYVDGSADVYQAVRANVRAGVRAGGSRCGDNRTSRRVEQCREAYERCLAVLDQIDGDVQGLAATLKNDLEERRTSLSSRKTPTRRVAELSVPVGEALRRVPPATACDIPLRALSVNGVATRLDACAAHVAALSAVLDEAAARREESLAFTADYERRVADESRATGESFARHRGLAEVGGAAWEGTLSSVLLAESAQVRRALSSSDAPLGDAFLDGLRRDLAERTRRRQTAAEQLALNRDVLQRLAGPAVAVEAALRGDPRRGEKDLRMWDGRDYFARHLRRFIPVLRAAGEGRGAGTQTVADQEATLARLSREVEDLKVQSLEARHAALDGALREAEAALAGVAEPCAETVERRDYFTAARRVRDRLAEELRPETADGEVTLAASFWEGVRDRAAARTADCRTRELSLIDIFDRRAVLGPRDADGRYPEELIRAQRDADGGEWRLSPAAIRSRRRFLRAAEAAWASAFSVDALSVTEAPSPRATMDSSLALWDESAGGIVTKVPSPHAVLTK